MRENPCISIDEIESAAADHTQPRQCNYFELRLKEGIADKPGTFGAVKLESEVWIDGSELDEPHFIDLPMVVRSLHTSGWHEIFTCSCGVSGCAGIAEGIYVSHDAGLVSWNFRRPQSAGNLLDPALKTWEKTAHSVSLVFKRNQMFTALQAYLNLIRNLVGNDPHRFQWSVHGLSVQDVLKIDLNRLV